MSNQVPHPGPILDNFTQGWACMPAKRSAHYWKPVTGSKEVVNGKVVQRYVSECGHTVKHAETQIHAEGGMPRCYRCEQRTKASAHWSDEECKTLVDLYLDGQPHQNIAFVLTSRSPHAIMIQLGRLRESDPTIPLGVDRRSRKWARPELEKLAELKAKNWPWREIALALKRTVNSVETKWKKLQREDATACQSADTKYKRPRRRCNKCRLMFQPTDRNRFICPSCDRVNKQATDDSDRYRMAL